MEDIKEGFDKKLIIAFYVILECEQIDKLKIINLQIY